MENEAVDLLCRYIRIDTSNPPGNEYKTAEFFERIFYQADIKYTTYEPKPGRVSLRAALKGSGEKAPVILLHHQDVIAAGKEDWTFDPFGGEIRDGFICGRGTLDTKSLGIIQLLALLDVKKQGLALNRDVIYLATADEETGGECGVEHLLKHHPQDFKAEVVLNEGSFVVSGITGDRLVAMISPGEKGPCWMKMRRRGMPGHGSTPHGQNALEKLTQAVNRLIDYNPPPRVTPIVAEYFKKLSSGWEFLKPYAEDGKDETLVKILGESGLTGMPQVSGMLRNTISLNQLKAGHKVNVIPAYAEAEVDTRLLPGQKVDEWLLTVKTLLADDEIEIDAFTAYEGNESDIETDSYRAIEQVLVEHYPGAITAPYLMLGTTDSRFFRETGTLAYGVCPAVVPMDHLKSVHGFDEKIGVDSFLKGIEVYKDILRRLCT